MVSGGEHAGVMFVTRGEEVDRFTGEIFTYVECFM